MTRDLIPYLGFNGQCEQAFQFYAKALRGEIVAMMRYSDAPADVPRMPGSAERIMHAHLKVGERSLMGGDSPNEQLSPPHGFCVAYQVDDPAEAARVFAALAEGAKVTAPLGPTFFAQQFAMLTDKFAIPWIINCPRPR